MNLTLIYQDEYIVCVSKPNDVVVHHAHHSRNVAEEESLLQLLYKDYNQKFYPIHRLDRRTSGIILLAKETRYVAEFQKLFTNDLIQKTYLGVVRGHAPESKIIDSPVKGRDSKVYKEAETHLKTLEKITLNIPVNPYDSSRYSLVELQPKTGRLHQLRIHMNKISHPLIGDGKYGDKNHNIMFEQNFECCNLFLHAYSLNFIHPFTQQALNLKANLPQNWEHLFKRFDWNI
ncbi:pseudouridine synthase [Tenacibaculum sp. IB213877]|uniref:pseudouridine synthase n=1 Tax=Tenacibaculum sp. IB213877 TaxID=3097351 RepID=UPI002A5AEC6F|nr:pseudouridine synthase [Tenacibaculum sp. IB213877]MDY0779480.1 pseudouridine synthase [Tenacibaculum sp. IB213877]